MTQYVKRCMMVAAPYAPLARALAAGLDATAGSGMFEVPVYDDQGQVVYYVSDGWIGEDFAVLLDDAEALHTAAAGAVTLEQCQAMLAASIVSAEEDAHAICAREGMTLAKPEPEPASEAT